MPVASFGREKTRVTQDQSKAWPELLLSQPEGLQNSPKDPDHNIPQRSEAVGRMRAVPPPPTQPSGLKTTSHLYMHSHAWSNHTDQTPEQALP